MRCGVIKTIHGSIETPCFFFCATKASLKSLSMDAVDRCHTQALLANTYHLMLQPGEDIVSDLGGLHGFMGWKKPIFTDSGGYQIFSLHHGSVSQEIKGTRNQPKKEGVKPAVAKMPGVRITEEGALFTSQINGDKYMLSPERSMQVQCALGADLMCVLDECTALHMSKDQTQASMERSHRWEDRSLAAFTVHKRPYQGLYGIVQGGIYKDLRAESAQFVSSRPFFGHAIGGSLGANKTQMREVVDMALEGLAPGRPIHLLGIGGVEDIFAGVERGIDTFDCVSPTRLGRHGGALVQPFVFAQEGYPVRGHLNLWNTRFKKDDKPIQEGCPCATCQRHSRAYLHHLLKAHEMSAMSFLTEHNMMFMNRLMASIRQAIRQKNLQEIKKDWIDEESTKRTFS